MFDVFSSRGGRLYCDGFSRRSFLRVGTLGAAGLTLPGLLRLRAAASPARGRPCRSVIMVMMSGGPSHIDTYDMKPDAPAEYRGEFRPIPTAIPGLRFCELLPLQAKL